MVDDFQWFDVRNVQQKCERDLLLDCDVVSNTKCLYEQCLQRKSFCQDSEQHLSLSTECQHEQKRIAIISTTFDDDYLFFTPLTTLNWRSAMQYDVAVVIVGPLEALEASQQIQLVVNETLSNGADIFFLTPGDDVRAATVSQVARLFVPLHYADDDYLLTSDGDMWVLDRAHFDRKPTTALPVHLYNANAYKHLRDETMYPICYIGMRATLWRQVLSLADEIRAHPHLFDQQLGTLVETLLQSAATFYGRMHWDLAAKAASKQWYFDQILFGHAIAQWNGHPTQCQRIDRFPFRDRIDRARWSFVNAKDLVGKIDAHLLRPGFVSNNWLRLRMLFKAILEKYEMSKMMKKVDDYVKNFNE